ncbi:acylneuraminate cytidylyltransferase, partial [Escherichia coli]|nr:acylneuraminate cytidylyltransferase [Escherichia coli]
SIPPVLGRIDRNNETIRKLNSELSKFFENYQNVIFITLSKVFYDQYGNLKENFTYDGLHFSQLAYNQLTKEIEEKIK